MFVFLRSSIHTLGYDAERLDRMSEATVMQLISLQAMKKKAEPKEILPGTAAASVEKPLPMVICPAGQHNGNEVIYEKYWLRPIRAPIWEWWPKFVGVEGCIPPATFLAMHQRWRKLEIKHFMVCRIAHVRISKSN